MSKLLDRLSHFILRLSIRIDHYSDAWMGHPRAWAIRLSMNPSDSSVSSWKTRSSSMNRLVAARADGRKLSTYACLLPIPPP